MSETIQTDLIYDLGMHDGQDTDFYLKKGFRVVAVEANGALAAEGRRRFSKEIIEGRLHILQVAVANEERSYEFIINKQNSKWSSIFKQWGERGHKGSETETVQGVRLENIARVFGVPYYLKIDIEGADLIALNAVRRMPARPKMISVEGGGEDFLKVFAELGYDRFAIVNQKDVPSTALPDPAREGRFAKHEFPLGATGPFGREIEGEWLTLEETARKRAEFRAIIKAIQEKFPGDRNRIMQERQRQNLGWYDVHATTAEHLSG